MLVHFSLLSCCMFQIGRGLTWALEGNHRASRQRHQMHRQPITEQQAAQAGRICLSVSSVHLNRQPLPSAQVTAISVFEVTAEANLELLFDDLHN